MIDLGPVIGFKHQDPAWPTIHNNWAGRELYFDAISWVASEAHEETLQLGASLSRAVPVAFAQSVREQIGTDVGDQLW